MTSVTKADKFEMTLQHTASYGDAAGLKALLTELFDPKSVLAAEFGAVADDGSTRARADQVYIRALSTAVRTGDAEALKTVMSFAHKTAWDPWIFEMAAMRAAGDEGVTLLKEVLSSVQKAAPAPAPAATASSSPAPYKYWGPPMPLK